MEENWSVMQALEVTPEEPFGYMIVRLFENQDFLQEADSNETLLQSRLSIAPEARLQQTRGLHEKSWKTVSMNLVLTGALRDSLPVDPSVTEFLTLCDGTRTLAETTEWIAAAHGADLTQVRRECGAFCRALLRRGLMVVSPG
jgi:hypothetical protein